MNVTINYRSDCDGSKKIVKKGWNHLKLVDEFETILTAEFELLKGKLKRIWLSNHFHSPDTAVERNWNLMIISSIIRNRIELYILIYHAPRSTLLSNYIFSCFANRSLIGKNIV